MPAPSPREGGTWSHPFSNHELKTSPPGGGVGVTLLDSYEPRQSPKGGGGCTCPFREPTALVDPSVYSGRGVCELVDTRVWKRRLRMPFTGSVDSERSRGHTVPRRI